MKNVVEFLITIITSIFTLLLFTLFIIILILSTRFINVTLKYTDYYSDATTHIKYNLSNYLVDSSLKKVLDIIITEERVEKDIEFLLKDESLVDKNINNDFKYYFMDILKDSNYDEKSLDNLVKKVSTLYKKSLFPYKDYFKFKNMIDNELNVKYVLIIVLISIILLLVISGIMKVFKNIIVRTNYFNAFCYIFIYIFTKKIITFDKFYYINDYFSNYLILSFNILIDFLLFVSLILLIINLFIESKDVKNN